MTEIKVVTMCNSEKKSQSGTLPHLAGPLTLLIWGSGEATYINIPQ